MKGRRKELSKSELHAELCRGLGVDFVSSEYGMTELLSQAYSLGEGIFECPSWMQISIRDTEDALSYVREGKTGGINVIDLANINSCSFIATQDLGKKYSNGSFFNPCKFSLPNKNSIFDTIFRINIQEIHFGIAHIYL
jgi:hypothetical protein